MTITKVRCAIKTHYIGMVVHKLSMVGGDVKPIMLKMLKSKLEQLRVQRCSPVVPKLVCTSESPGELPKMTVAYYLSPEIVAKLVWDAAWAMEEL